VTNVPDRLTIITGAASGIGAAVARRLVRDRLCALVDVDDKACRKLARELGQHAIAAPLDITDSASAIETVCRLAGDHGPVAGLVNSAGGGAGARFEALDRTAWDSLIALNLTGTFNLISAALPHFHPDGGAIVNVASIAAVQVSPKGGAAYAAAKAGVLGVSRQTAAELAPRRIRVNTVLPGPTRTALTTQSRLRDEDFPLGRWVEADDIAAGVAWLLSSEATMCTGCELRSDGGGLVRPERLAAEVTLRTY